MENVVKDIGLISFGDSFTVGYYSSGNNTNGYAKQLGDYIGGTFTNYGLGSSYSTYATKKALEVLPEGYRRPVVTWMAGLNDIREQGLPAVGKIGANLRAFLASCFLRDCVPASLLKRTGTWTALPNAYGGKAYYCGGTPLYITGNANATLTYDFYGDNLVVGAYRTNGTTGYYQDLSITVDGGTPVTFPLFGLTVEQISHDAKILRGFGAGWHRAVIKPVNALNFTVLDYVGTLVDGGTQSPVFVSKIPYLVNWAQYGSIANQSICDAANAVIESVVTDFNSPDVALIDVNSFYNLSTGCYTDGLHPNQAGHTQIADGFKASINLITL